MNYATYFEFDVDVCIIMMAIQLLISVSLAITAKAIFTSLINVHLFLNTLTPYTVFLYINIYTLRLVGGTELIWVCLECQDVGS